MPDETENLTLMAVLLAGISGCILTWTGSYVMYWRENSNPLVVYSCLAVSVILLAFSFFVFRAAERRRENEHEPEEMSNLSVCRGQSKDR